MAEMPSDLFAAMRRALRPGAPPGSLSGFGSGGFGPGGFSGPDDGSDVGLGLDLGPANRGGAPADPIDANAEETARVRALIDERRRALRETEAPVSAGESATKFIDLDVRAACELTSMCRAADELASAANRAAELVAVQALNVGRILANEDPPTFPPAPRGIDPEIALRGRFMTLAKQFGDVVAELDRLAAAATRHANGLGTASRTASLAGAAATAALEAAGALAPARPATVSAAAGQPPPPDVYAAAAAAIAAARRAEFEPARE